MIFLYLCSLVQHNILSLISYLKMHHKPNNQQFLKYVMYGRFANAHINKTFFTSSLLSVISIVNSAFGIENTLLFFL